MIYFYAGLGAAMLTGVMVLFEVGLALTGQSLFVDGSQSDNYRDVVNSSDRLFQRMFAQQQDLKAIGTGRSGDVLCQQILCRIQGINCRFGNSKNPSYVSLDSYSTPRYSLPLGAWSSSCALERELDCDIESDPNCIQAQFVHRLLIKPHRQMLETGYGLYSCIVDREIDEHRCLFERGG